jgi:hypothetical protein
LPEKREPEGRDKKITHDHSLGIRGLSPADRTLSPTLREIVDRALLIAG